MSGPQEIPTTLDIIVQPRDVQVNRPIFPPIVVEAPWQKDCHLYYALAALQGSSGQESEFGPNSQISTSAEVRRQTRGASSSSGSSDPQKMYFTFPNLTCPEVGTLYKIEVTLGYMDPETPGHSVIKSKAETIQFTVHEANGEVDPRPAGMFVLPIQPRMLY